MKCEHCPMAGSDRGCPALSRPHPRYCELVDPSHPDHDPAFVEVVAGMAGDPGSGSISPRYDPKRYESITLLVLDCDYRGRPVLACGCTGTRVCLAGKGRPIPGTDATDATDHDCRICVTHTESPRAS